MIKNFKLLVRSLAQEMDMLLSVMIRKCL